MFSNLEKVDPKALEPSMPISLSFFKINLITINDLIFIFYKLIIYLQKNDYSKTIVIFYNYLRLDILSHNAWQPKFPILLYLIIIKI